MLAPPDAAPDILRTTPAEPDGAGSPPSRLSVIAKRSDFLRAARGRKTSAGSFLLQARRRDGADGIRFGVTASKKVGNAVARNRAKRRLRAAARTVLPEKGRPGWDYVLIAFAETTAARPWQALLSDFDSALARVHA